MVVALMVALMTTGGCNDDDPVEPQPQAPVITITGVEDGVTYTDPVTITVSLDVGTYAATLNGQPFTSGSTVSDVGTYLLRVDADNQGATSNETVTFFMTLPGDRFLFARVFDLGDPGILGGGDAILLTDSSSAGASHVLIDAGPAGAEADSSHVADRLLELGVDTLDALVLTHAHLDHYAGIPAVVNAVGVRRFYHNGQSLADDRYEATIALATSRADATITPTAPEILGLGDPGGPNLTILPPFPAFLDLRGATDSQLNEGSLGGRVDFGAFSMFLTGDGQLEANNRWRNTWTSLSFGVDVLKVGHHGANDAIFNNETDGASIWLDHTRPEVVLISANGRTHPEGNAVGELSSRGIETWCTNAHGGLILIANAEGQYVLLSERDGGAACTAGQGAGR
jgi:competence protein ComEC